MAVAFQTVETVSTPRIQDADLSANTGFVCGQSRAIQRLNGMVKEVAQTDIPILLVGESGTGKGVYGRLIHRLSKGCEIPLRELNCRALASGEFRIQLESYLRANEDDSKPNLQTLLLDGVDELDLECQRFLLSQLPDGEALERTHSGVRLLASACRSLDEECEAGRFRKELYFRINGVCLHLPPLRDRKEDIPSLMEHFLARYARPGQRIPVLNDAEMSLLRTHDWPGNVREFENLARKIAVLSDARKALDGFQPVAKAESRVREDPQKFSLKVAARAASRQTERELILKALEKTHWNRKRAARDLEISYKSLLYKIKQTGLEVEG